MYIKRWILALTLVTMMLVSIASADDVQPAASQGKDGKTGIFANEKIKVAGKQRAYRLVVPKDLPADKPVPLLFAFHGLGDSKDLMAFYSQLDKLAAKEHFILIYPNAVNRMWPIVPIIAGEDLAFFDKLYDLATESYNIDLDRVYLTGMSNGAYFSHVVASERADKIAAIAPHSGGLGVFARRELKVKPKYAVFVIHGDADSIVPVKEGRATRDAYKKWGHQVEYLEVKDWNHLWAFNVDVNSKMWKFFADHPRQKEDVK